MLSVYALQELLNGVFYEAFLSHRRKRLKFLKLKDYTNCIPTYIYTLFCIITKKNLLFLTVSGYMDTLMYI